MASYKCKPGKWVWGLIPLALPFLGAWFLNTPIMVGKLSQTAQESLKTAGFESVSVIMDGRDAVLAGQVSGKQAMDAAARSVAGVYGIRRVVVMDVKIVKPVVLELPTVIRTVGNNAQPEITGTWPEGVATTLAVKIGEKNYVLGTDPELSSDGKGTWKLKPSSPLVDGTHDIEVAVSDGKKAAAVDNSKNELAIDTKPPAAPSIGTRLVTKQTRPAISGTWAAKEAKSLVISLAGKNYTLGADGKADGALSADGKGNWTLTPPDDLGDGVYDVTVKTADQFGNVSQATTTGALTVDTTGPETGSVMVSQGADPTPLVTGTWPGAAGNTLKVSIDKKTYTLGKDKELTVDGKGNWALKPGRPLAPGKYAVTVTSADALGNESSMTSPGVVVIDNTPPAAPVVTSVVNATTAPVLKGTWAEKAGNTLKVVVAGKIFALGRDKQLTSDGNGNWTLSLNEPLSEGKFPILAESSDAFGNLVRNEEPAVVAVDTTRPDAPTIKKLSSRSRTPTITGTWPQSDENSLRVTLDGKTYEFGKDAQLSSDGKTNWSLTPSVLLADGSYDIVATVTDQAGNTSVAESKEAVIIDNTGPNAPTVTTVLTRDRTPLITGTWDSSDAVDLSVSVAGQSFSNARQGEIEINGDHWSVSPRAPIADGTYDVVAIVADKLGNRSKDLGVGELVIDGTSPTIPTVRPVFGTNKRPPVGGTWPEDGQNSLAVTIAGKSYSLSKSGPLKSDGKGNWKLSLTQDLPVGTYDVKVKVADRLGNQSNDVSNGEIWIKAEKKPEAPAQKKTSTQGPCTLDFTAALVGQSIGFKTSKVEIDAASQSLITRLAEIAKACPGTQIEVSGYTDSRGSTSFNQSLSEGRASAVVDALVARGVAKTRLRALGYGERLPIADNNTKTGRAKNRRIEFKIEQ